MTRNWIAILCSASMALFVAPVLSSAFEAPDDEFALEGEPTVVIEDLTKVTEVILPTQFLRTSRARMSLYNSDVALSTYQFVLDFESGLIYETPGEPNQPIQSSCVGPRLEMIKEIITENQLCDFSQVKQLRPPQQACLTVIYPDYLMFPLEGGDLMMGIGSRVDSCALPERDLCDLSEARRLRKEIEALSSDFITQIEEGATPGQCL